MNGTLHGGTASSPGAMRLSGGTRGMHGVHDAEEVTGRVATERAMQQTADMRRSTPRPHQCSLLWAASPSPSKGSGTSGTANATSGGCNGVNYNGKATGRGVPNQSKRTKEKLRKQLVEGQKRGQVLLQRRVQGRRRRQQQQREEINGREKIHLTELEDWWTREKTVGQSVLEFKHRPVDCYHGQQMSPVSPMTSRTAAARAMREKAWSIGTSYYTRINDPAPSRLDWQHQMARGGS